MVECFSVMLSRNNLGLKISNFCKLIMFSLASFPRSSYVDSPFISRKPLSVSLVL